MTRYNKKSPKGVGDMGAFVFGVIGAVGLTLATMIPLQSWAAGQQVKASRKGRFEAMKKDLSNPAQFAILSDEQKKQVEKEAEKISDKEALESATKGGFKDLLNPFKRIKDVLFENKKAELERAEFNKKFEADLNNFDLPLGEQDTEKAQRDQQLLTKLSEKIDIVSQEYTEDVELATGAISAAAFAGGGLVGFISKKILDICKVQNKTAKSVAPMAIGFAIPMLATVLAAKVQKQASRVARFKAIQELKQSPQEFLYVNDDKAADIQAQQPETPKKKNIFAFLLQVYKENKEYNQHLKTEGLKEKKFSKSLSNLQLDEAQEKEAKLLQRNTFKTFNKIDEKSQIYSESTEAYWEKIKVPVVLITEFIGMGIGMAIGMKKADKNPLAAMIGPILGIMPALFAQVGIDIIATKEQKQASRVANMEAIKELEDYRHFADYDNSTKAQEETIDNAQPQQDNPASLNDFQKMLATA